jgi:hypothetical protein
MFARVRVCPFASERVNFDTEIIKNTDKSNTRFSYMYSYVTLYVFFMALVQTT